MKKWKILLLVLVLCAGCTIGNKQLYCGVKDFGDTSKYQDNMQTERRAN